VTIASPLSGQWVSNFLLTVSGTANDPPPNASGLTRVLLSVNGELQVTATGTTNWSRTFGLIPGTQSHQRDRRGYRGKRFRPGQH